MQLTDQRDKVIYEKELKEEFGIEIHTQDQEQMSPIKLTIKDSNMVGFEQIGFTNDESPTKLVILQIFILQKIEDKDFNKL